MTGDETAAGRARVASLLDLGRWDDATRLLAPLLASAPDDTALLLLMTRAHLGADRDDEALTTVDAAIATAPEDPQAHYWRTVTLLALHRPAQDSAQRAIELAPYNPYAWFLMTRAQMDAGHWRRAQDAAESTLRLAPGMPIGHHALGLYYLRRLDWSKAEEQYRAALALAPTNPDYLNNLGLAMLRQGKSKDAVDHFVSAGELAPGDSDLYRRNAAAAGEAYIRKPQSKLRRQVGLVIGVVIFVLLIVFASGGPAFVVPLVVGLVVTALVIDRVRMRRLPPAARMAVQSQRRQRRTEWRAPKRSTARQWRAVVTVVVLAGLALVIGLTSDRNAPDPGPTETDAALCAAAGEGTLTNNNGTLITPQELGCPDV